MMAGDFLTTKETADLLKVSHWTVSAWLSQGKLKRVKAGGRTLIARSDLDDFLTRSSTPPRPPRLDESKNKRRSRKKD
jgi:excisionase family DNA binding protein